MLIQNKQGTFKGANGIELYYQTWHPPAIAKAVLLMVHGHGGHSGIFDRVVESLNEQNYLIYSFDLRGNGRSPGQQGYINNWAEFRADLTAFIDLVTAENPNLPLFLLGQSLGGTIVLDYALREADSIQGLIVMSPALGLGISQVLILLSKLLSAVLPRFSLDTGIDFSACSRDTELLPTLAQDSLRHSLGTTRLTTELLKTMNWIHAHATNLKVPILILHGGADTVTLAEDSKAFYNRLTTADKEIKIYPDSYHELQHDLNYQEVLADISNWLNRHL